MRTRTLLLGAALLAATALSAPAPAHAAPSVNNGTFYSATPTRLADSRIGLGVPKRPLASGSTTSLRVLGTAGVPATGVSAVVVNITVTTPTKAGWITAYASGTAKPKTSTINFPVGWTGATTATVAVGADGRIAFSTDYGQTEMIVDIVGYYGSATSTGRQGAFFNPDDPWRLFDSRSGSKIASGENRTVTLDFGPTPGQVPTALSINLTAIGDSSRSGWLTAWSGAGTRPGTSAVNVGPGEISPNQTIVPLRSVGGTKYAFTLSNTSRIPLHAFVDFSGAYLTDSVGSGFIHVPVAPTRVLDTRFGPGPIGALKAGVRKEFTIPANLMHPAGLSVAVEGTVTGTGATQRTWLTQWPANPGLIGEASTPNTSNLNLVPGRTRANGLTMSLGSSVANVQHLINAVGTVNVVEDITGRFDLGGFDPAAAAARAATTRTRLAHLPAGSR